MCFVFQHVRAQFWNHTSNSVLIYMHHHHPYAQLQDQDRYGGSNLKVCQCHLAQCEFVIGYLPESENCRACPRAFSNRCRTLCPGTRDSWLTWRHSVLCVLSDMQPSEMQQHCSASSRLMLLSILVSCPCSPFVRCPCSPFLGCACSHFWVAVRLLSPKKAGVTLPIPCLDIPVPGQSHSPFIWYTLAFEIFCIYIYIWVHICKNAMVWISF